MEKNARILRELGCFLGRNRLGCVWFFALLVPGACFGAALFEGLGEECLLASLDAAARGAFPAVRPIGMLLLSSLPALLFGVSMLLCSLQRGTLPLWGLCVFLLGAGFGMAGGCFAALAESGRAALGVLTVLLPFLLTSPGYAALSLLPLERLRQGEDGDGRRFALRLLTLSCALSALASTCATFAGRYALHVMQR